jgi:filamentous hemagglutinin family protein
LAGNFGLALPPRVSLALVAVCSLAAVLPRVSAAQHITVDGRFSPAQTLVGPNYSVTANLGKQMGGNLFHSFGQFNLATPEKATFTSTGSTGPISNVISRVTGGNGSKIDGTIQSNIAGANLYLINPNGILFGPNATVNVSGSFHASTADYLKLQDGAKFQATNPDGSTLSAAPPAAFGFLTATPRPIGVAGSTLGPVPGTLGLVAGPISIVGGTLTAPSGTIHLASAAGTGEVPVDPTNTPALTVKTFGPVDIKNGSTLNVSDRINLGSGGSVFIRAGALTIDASNINADNYGSNPGGSVVVSAGSLMLANGGQILDRTLASGDAGSILVTVSDQLTIDSSAGIFSQARPGSTGNAGTVAVTVGSVSILNSGAISGSTFASGNAGSIKITASGRLTIDSSGGIFSQANSGSSGAAGTVMVTAGSLSIVNNGSISTQNFGPGNGGSVSIDVTSSQAGALTILTNGSVSASTFGIGNAGSISVRVAGGLMIDGAGANPDFITGISSRTSGPGKAGNIIVSAGKLTLRNSGEISTSTFASGNAGSIKVTASDQLMIDSSGGIFAEADSANSGAAGTVMVSAGSLSIVNDGSISTQNFGPGNGGSVSIDVTSSQPEALTILTNGSVSASTFGIGNGGSVSMRVAGGLMIDGTGANLTGIFAQSNAGSNGNAGDVTVKAGSLSIVNSGLISSSALGPANSLPASTGNAGLVTIAAGALSLANNGNIRSATFGSGKAGNILVSAETLSIASNGIISTQNFGPGNGGSVSIDVTSSQPGALTILANGSVSASTFGVGNAGSISVRVAGGLMIDGAGANPDSPTGIFSQTNSGVWGMPGT